MAPRKKEDFKEMQEVSREKILMAALELFASHGYARTSVESIAVRARISKGLIYHYFKSKQDILKNLFRLLVEQIFEMINRTGNLTPKQFLQQMIDSSIFFMTQQTKINRLILSLTLQPEVIRGLQKEFEKIREEWMESITQIFRELKFEKPETEAYLFGAMMDGMSVGYITMGKDYPVKELKQLIEKRYGL